MVHEGQSLALGLEAGDDLASVHAGLDQLHGDAPADWLLLLGQPDLAHAAFADQFEQVVRTDDQFGAGRRPALRGFLSRMFEKAAGSRVCV